MRVCPQCYQLYGPDRDECDKDAVKLVHYTQVLIGLQLGPYVVRSLISEGGMGVVYTAEHPALGRRVAIKVLRPELSLRDDIVERFTQEARAVNTIGHQNIVNIYDFGKTPFGSFYIVMEYLEGMTVRTLLDEAGPQPLEQVRLVVQEVATALAAAHSKGFVHRDVTPANIMLCQHGHKDFIKLLDFGIAKLLTSAAETTDAGVAMGTPRYMSPEQLDAGATDPRTDIYALGVVAYELFTGQAPFPGATQAAVRHAQASYRPQAPSLSRRDIRLAPSVDEFVFTAIATNPAERFQTMEGLAEAFRRAYDDTIAQQSHTPAALPSVVSRRRLLLPLGGAALTLAALYAIWWAAGRVDRGQHSAQPGVVRSAGAGAPAATSESASAPRAAPQTARQIVTSALTAKNRENRRAMLEKLQLVKPACVKPELLSALHDDDSIVRRIAALTLAEMKSADQATLRELRAVMPQQMSFAAIAVAQALAQLGDRRGLARLRRELVLSRRQGPRAVRFALEALAEVDPATAPRLAPFAHSMQWEDSPEAKARLLLKMARGGVKQAAADLLDAARAQPSEMARLHAAIGYAELDYEQVRSTLRSLSRTASGPIKARATGVLAEHGDVNAASSLLELLNSAESAVRMASALSLGRARTSKRWPKELDARARKELTRLLRDPNDEVRSAAAAAMLALYDA